VPQRLMAVLRESATRLAGRHQQFRNFLAQQGSPSGFTAAEIAHMVLSDGASPARKLTFSRIKLRPLLPQREACFLEQVLDILAPGYEREQEAINPALVRKQEGDEVVVGELGGHHN